MIKLSGAMKEIYQNPNHTAILSAINALYHAGKGRVPKKKIQK